MEALKLELCSEYGGCVTQVVRQQWKSWVSHDMEQVRLCMLCLSMTNVIPAPFPDLFEFTVTM
jgi:hypothetical protein